MSGEVHNHGPAEGRGLDCGERLVNGRLVGHCVSGAVCVCMPHVECPLHPADPTLVEVVSEHHLASGFTRSNHTSAVVCGCGFAEEIVDQGRTYEDLHNAHLAAILEPYVQQRVSAALEGAASLIEDCVTFKSGPYADGIYSGLDQAARTVREAKP